MMGLQLVSPLIVILLLISLVRSALLSASFLSGSTSIVTTQGLGSSKLQLSQTATTNQEVLELGSIKSVKTVAQAISVRILGKVGSGSGVIVQRQGQTYTILTNAHVLAAEENPYTILTSDGKTHSGHWRRSVSFGGKDLALVQFTSNQTYQVAVIGNSQTLNIGDLVYASGFPNWRLLNSTTLEDTRDLGLKAFQVTEGNVEMLLDRPLQQGYQLGYTNQVEQGMSGGAVLDRYGRLIGVNGHLKYPLQGITAFIFADGTTPSKALFQQMESLSWAVPSTTFQHLFTGKKIARFEGFSSYKVLNFTSESEVSNEF